MVTRQPRFFSMRAFLRAAAAAVRIRDVAALWVRRRLDEQPRGDSAAVLKRRLVLSRTRCMHPCSPATGAAPRPTAC
ncbi:hypothetical protein GGX14DRAFT_142827 [Mycena pura]|uniref:Uncharacterized protein n=1 Tax=Mycena pura TaxID=153505 RepID=A0AAD6V640_9AGAR|nr:hypothetical protein GGX14DRAFT_142827 [Mycena pura]